VEINFLKIVLSIPALISRLIDRSLSCSDEHCIQLVKSGFAVKLLALLNKHPVDLGRSVTHHAILSALRNLAIPGWFFKTFIYFVYRGNYLASV